MPPRLRPACSMFWLAWLISLAYWFGSWTYNFNYVIRNDSMKDVELVMISICLFISSLAFMGCCFLFFDVTNFFWILLYGIPLGLAVPALCIFGFIQISKVELPTPQSIQAGVVKHWDEHAQSPHYLSRTEKDLLCCGLNGPSDYREFIYGKNCETQKLDVPYSCCNLTYLFTHGERSNSKVCTAVASENLFILNSTERCNSTMDSGNDTSPARRCKCIRNGTKLSKEFSGQIYTKGCVNLLMKNTEDMKFVHFWFVLIFMAVSGLMTMVFLTAWCHSPQVVDLAPHFAKSKTSQQTMIQPDDHGKKGV